MRRFKNILLVAENGVITPDVGDRALSLAKSNGARVTVADVIAVDSGDLHQFFGSLLGSSASSVEKELLAIREAELEEITKPFKAEGIDADSKVLSGVGFIELIRQVLRGNHDLVMKAAGSEGERRWRVFSSTELHLLRKCPCPVWLVKPRRGDHYHRILAAIDPFQDDEESDPVARLIMDLSTSLSVMEHSDLDVVHAWHLIGEDAMRNSAMAKIPKAEIDRMSKAQYEKDQARVERILGPYPQVDRSRVHLIKGEPEDVIIDYTQENGVDLIVMGTIGHTGIRGLLIGNTAESVLTRVDCSVMAVKPKSFETPVSLED